MIDKGTNNVIDRGTNNVIGESTIKCKHKSYVIEEGEPGRVYGQTTVQVGCVLCATDVQASIILLWDRLDTTSWTDDDSHFTL